jgi:hypothetical protein
MNEFESPALPGDCYLTCPIVCFFIPLVSNGKLFIVLSIDKDNPSDESKRFSEKINKAREDGVMYLRKIYK